MKKIFSFLYAALAVAALAVPAELSAAPKNPKRERIVVSEPRAISGITQADINGISEYIESKLGGNYDIFSRTALKAILDEYKFVDSSGLVNDPQLRQQLAQKSVDCLLVYSISKLGSRLSLTMMVVNSSTGEIRKGQRASVTAAGLDELVRRLDSALDSMGLLAGADEPAVKKLAVMPVSAGRGVQRSIPEALHTKLSSFILKSGSFELVSREDMSRIAKESALTDHSLAASNQYAKIGQLQLADYLAVVAIDRYDHYSVGGGTAMAGSVTPSGRLTIQMSLRIVDVKTGKIIAVETLRDSMRSTEIPAASRRDWTAADYDNAFLERASAKLGNALLQRLDPVLVATVEGSSVYLTRGSGAGVYNGQYFHVYNPGRQIIHPKTKRILGTTESFAATIKVVETAADLSIAAICGKPAAPIQPGAICRSTDPGESGTVYGVAPAPAAAAPAYPMAN